MLGGESFFFQAEDGIRDLVRSRGLGDVYKRQIRHYEKREDSILATTTEGKDISTKLILAADGVHSCLLYTSDAADERSSVDLGGRRIIKKTNSRLYKALQHLMHRITNENTRPTPKNNNNTHKHINK